MKSTTTIFRRSTTRQQQSRERRQPASPGLASNGKPLRLNLKKCALTVLSDSKKELQREASLYRQSILHVAQACTMKAIYKMHLYSCSND